MKTEYFVRRDPKEPELHIYIEYSERGGVNRREWMGTLRSNTFEMNDHLKPELEDMRFIVNLADNFSIAFADAKEDAWDMDAGDCEIPDENFQ